MSISHGEKYLFDLNGYIIVKNVFEKEEIAEMNEIIDRKASQMRERSCEVRNTRAGSALEGDGATGRRDLGNLHPLTSIPLDPFLNPTTIPNPRRNTGMG